MTVDAPFCVCGCGRAVTRIKKTDRARGRVKGEWNQYAFGHGPRPWALDPAERRARDRARARRWYAANRPRARAARAKYRVAHADEIGVKREAWVDANRERLREYWRAYHHANKATRSIQARAYRARMADEMRDSKRLRQAARRARKRERFVEHVHPLFVLERDDGVCGICGGDVDPLDFHVDHVVALANGGGHSYGNVQLAHPACNMRKGWDKSPARP
jgi:5-methylcytosine-specific restriction endonuclease McrA